MSVATVLRMKFIDQKVIIIIPNYTTFYSYDIKQGGESGILFGIIWVLL